MTRVLHLLKIPILALALALPDAASAYAQPVTPPTPPVAQPAPSTPRDQLLPLYKASHDKYRALVRASAGADVNRVTMPNPFFPSVRMRMATVLLVIPAHDRRHLWQAKRVKELLRGA